METFMIVVFVVFFVVTLGFIAFGFLAVFSPTVRSKWIGRQLEMQKKVLEDNKETIKDIHALGGEVTIDSANKILDKKGKDIKHAMDRSTDISSDSIKKVARAIKDGIKDEMYCKHCGASVDSDSNYCKKCGKKV